MPVRSRPQSSIALREDFGFYRFMGGVPTLGLGDTVVRYSYEYGLELQYEYPVYRS